MKKFLLNTLAVFFALFVVIILTVLYMGSEPAPKGTQGPGADQLAQKIQARLNHKGWESAAAIRFSRGDLRHIRDLKRSLAEVKFPNGDRIIFNLKSGKHRAFRLGKALPPEEARSLYVEAKKQHTIDFFWLNPMGLLFESDATRFKVGNRALLFQLKENGLAPTDSYLIITDRDGLPKQIRVWSGSLIIRGSELTFHDWIKTETQVAIALQRSSFLIDIQFHSVKMYPTYPEPGGSDRFQGLGSPAP